METRLQLIVVGHVQDADLVLPAFDVMIVVKVHVRLANVLVSALDLTDSRDCVFTFRSSSYMFRRSTGWR